MENKLKRATKDVISTLNDCKIRTIMATGDNTLTAISVARECNILNKEKRVFFGDIDENGRLIWKCSEPQESSQGAQSDDQAEHEVQVSDSWKDVPWDDDEL